ncbi:MAG: branched-chain amino acid ABC transporter permease [Streptococcaceae bacterium]|jgi:branched-chain amino acid transport system permease protein|nr:branched-chain amino acid ABC transporter permease [Streptococcaceae bacterium]
MKKNLKVNLGWLILFVLLYALLTVLIQFGIFNDFIVQIITQIGINIILAVGLNVVIGFAGQFSLGHAGFMLIGAYSGAIIGTQTGTYLGFFLAMLVGMLISGLAALLVGIPTLRLKGDYLAIATLGVAEIFRILVINGGSLTNGAAGLTGVPLFTNWQMVFVFVILTTILSLNFGLSANGRGIRAVRDDEIAAESMGVNATKVKVSAFVFGAVTASIAGTLYSGFIGTVTPKDFTFMNSVNILIIVVFGGLGSVTGSIVSAIVLGILNMYLQDFGSLRMIIFSLILILVMIFRPGGLLGIHEFQLSKLMNRKSKAAEEVK